MKGTQVIIKAWGQDRVIINKGAFRNHPDAFQKLCSGSGFGLLDTPAASPHPNTHMISWVISEFEVSQVTLNVTLGKSQLISVSGTFPIKQIRSYPQCGGFIVGQPITKVRWEAKPALGRFPTAFICVSPTTNPSCQPLSPYAKIGLDAGSQQTCDKLALPIDSFKFAGVGGRVK